MPVSDAFDDDDDDRPRRRRRDEDDDDPPRRRRRQFDDAEEDYLDDIQPRRRSVPDGMGQGAMITGIISLAITLMSLVGACICVLGIVGVILGIIGGIVAVILGFVARNRNPSSGTGLTGIITGFASIVIGLVLTVLLIIGVGAMALNAPNNPPPNQPGQRAPFR